MEQGDAFLQCISKRAIRSKKRVESRLNFRAHSFEIACRVSCAHAPQQLGLCSSGQAKASASAQPVARSETSQSSRRQAPELAEGASCTSSASPTPSDGAEGDGVTSASQPVPRTSLHPGGDCVAATGLERGGAPDEIQTGCKGGDVMRGVHAVVR
jgi:hypothetical protein